jgi:hypothetical protein
MNCRIQWAKACALLALLMRPSAHAQITFEPISLPDAEYLTGTAKLTVSAPNGYFVGALSDSAVSISFSAGGNYFPPISASTFATWSSPPYSESSSPGQVLYYRGMNIPGRSLYISFTEPLQTFGAEIQVESWNVTSPITATFYDGATQVGSISQTIGGVAGARLFAAHTDTAQFDKVVIYDPSSPTGFGIGQFRYAVVPEPSVMYVAVLAILGLFCSRRIRGRE